MDADDFDAETPPGDVHLCVLIDGSRIGIAYYDTGTESLHASSAFCTEPEFPWLAGILREQVISPVAIITGSSSSEAARRELGLRASEDGSMIENGVALKVLKQKSFALEYCTRLLEMVVVADAMQRLPVTRSSGPGVAAATPALHRAASLLDLNDSMLTRAAGGLLQHLLKSRVVIEDGSSDPPSLRLHGGVHLFSVDGFMHVDALSFAALSIFSREAHPSCVTLAGRIKEGFSLVALLDRTVSVPGRRMLQTWFRQPSVDIDLIRHRHDAVEVLMSCRNLISDVWKDLRACIKRGRDLGRILLRLKNVKATAGDWRALQQTLVAAGMARDHLLLMLANIGGAKSRAATAASQPRAPVANPEPFLLTQFVKDASLPELALLQSTLARMIDWDASKVRGQLAVQPGVDETLDAYRRTYEDMAGVLLRESHTELAQYPSIETLAIRFIPQIGCLVVLDKAANGLMPPPGTAPIDAASQQLVRAESADSSHWSAKSAMIPADFEFQFESAAEVHFKNPRMHELDKHFGDISSAIADLEQSVVRQLEELVLSFEGNLLTLGFRVRRRKGGLKESHSSPLPASAVQLAETDVLCSFAEVSQDYQYVRPSIVADNVFFVKGARHPLQELALSSGAFIPNDVALAPLKSSAIAIVTGPNCSGKSVYLKSIGVIAFMAQVGCFVPAERAILGVCDRLFTRIHSLESVTAQGQSSFTIDLNQVGLMMRHATTRSLLLIDEFGKGTSSIDGISLLAAVIRDLLYRTARGGPDGSVINASPKTVITTHFREVFDLDLLRLPHATLSALEAPAGAAVVTPPSIKFYQMDVVVDKQTSGASGGTADDPEYLDVVTPLFRLVPGRAAKSYGLACARMAGMPEGVLARAAAVTAALESGSPVPLPALSGPAAANFRRMFAAMESQAFCADAIMSVKDWCTADPAQLRVLLQYFVASAS